MSDAGMNDLIKLGKMLECMYSSSGGHLRPDSPLSVSIMTNIRASQSKDSNSPTPEGQWFTDPPNPVDNRRSSLMGRGSDQSSFITFGTCMGGANVLLPKWNCIDAGKSRLH